MQRHLEHVIGVLIPSAFHFKACEIQHDVRIVWRQLPGFTESCSSLAVAPQLLQRVAKIVPVSSGQKRFFGSMGANDF